MWQAVAFDVGFYHVPTSSGAQQQCNVRISTLPLLHCVTYLNASVHSNVLRASWHESIAQQWQLLEPTLILRGGMERFTKKDMQYLISMLTVAGLKGNILRLMAADLRWFRYYSICFCPISNITYLNSSHLTWTLSIQHILLLYQGRKCSYELVRWETYDKYEVCRS